MGYGLMSRLIITLHGPSGVLSTFETGEAQFVLGSETATDVYTVSGNGVAPRHAWLWITPDNLQVEDIAGGTLVNGYPISGRVEAVYPASVQIGETTLVVEEKSATTRVEPDTDVSQRQLGALGSTTAQSHYQLVREIARGGMGKIFVGDEPRLKRQVAVKVSTVSEGGEDPRFSREAEVLARLAHPNIVPIHNIGVDSEGRPFYSMKLVKGRTLQAVLNALKDGDPLTLKEYPQTTLLTIFCKICDAIAFAHSKGVLHRDLKPENVMVGEYGEVLAMDWGLAKDIGSNQGGHTSQIRVSATSDFGMTMEGEVMGTPQYMSPEQAEGMVSELDQRSDIYSLGGILYATLTLRPPIEGATLNEVLTKVKGGQISSMTTKRGHKSSGASVSPAAMEADVPEALQSVTRKAMATNREDRYASVEDLASDIKAYQNGFATSAESAGIGRRITLWIGRNRVLAGASALMVLVLSGFTAKVVAEGRRASSALKSLREMAPIVVAKAETELREGNFEEALRMASYAVELEPDVADFRRVQGNALQVLDRWPQAVKSYQEALRLGENERAEENQKLTTDLIALSEKKPTEAKIALFKALSSQGRNYEAMAYGKDLKEFWKGRKNDPGAAIELVKRLESKLLPVPGTEIQMCKTEFTVGEWKLYVRAEGLPPYEQPAKDFTQTDEHPLVMVTWEQAKVLCDWLSSKTGRTWRMPTNAEW